MRRILIILLVIIIASVGLGLAKIINSENISEHETTPESSTLQGDRSLSSWD